MSNPTSQLRERAERYLGSIILTIEFTLISVMVGVILFPLMDHAAVVLRDLRYEYWLYIVSGHLLILYHLDQSRQPLALFCWVAD